MAQEAIYQALKWQPIAKFPTKDDESLGQLL